MVNVKSPAFARVGEKVELGVLNREQVAEVRARHSGGDLPFKVVKGRDGLARIRFIMPEVDEVMFRVQGQADGPRLVLVRAQH